jgi:hypothetical protein
MKTKINIIQRSFGAVLSLLAIFGQTSTIMAQAPAGMALIPAGSFVMGDTFVEGSGDIPLHSVYVSAFYMDQFEITKVEWDVVYNWAVGHGYSFDYAGSGKAADHPVHTISWFDAVKWCNARSEMENKTSAPGGPVDRVGAGNSGLAGLRQLRLAKRSQILTVCGRSHPSPRPSPR